MRIKCMHNAHLMSHFVCPMRRLVLPIDGEDPKLEEDDGPRFLTPNSTFVLPVRLADEWLVALLQPKGKTYPYVGMLVVIVM